MSLCCAFSGLSSLMTCSRQNKLVRWEQKITAIAMGVKTISSLGLGPFSNLDETLLNHILAFQVLNRCLEEGRRKAGSHADLNLQHTRKS